MHHGAALARESGDPALAEAVASGEPGRLAPRLAAPVRYALALTRAPGAVSERDVEALRSAGLDDRASGEDNQWAAYYNYVTPGAHARGVELEEGWPVALRERRRYAPSGLPDLPVVRPDELPWLSVAQMRELDRLMIEELGITLERMMENAGRNFAELARGRLGGSVAGRRIVVLAGPGGNGGGGLVAARHLAGAGAAIDVRLATPVERLAPVTRAQLAILTRMGVRVSGDDGRLDGDLLLDALLGYSLRGDPRGGAAALIRSAAGARVISLDTPSGLELESGSLRQPHIRAEATLTLAAPKQGLRSGDGWQAVGELYLADLSVPSRVFELLGVPYTSPFSPGALLRVAI